MSSRGRKEAIFRQVGHECLAGCQYFLDIIVGYAYTFPVKINTYQKKKDQWGHTIAIDSTNSRTIPAGASKGGVF
jgi:hypothetical protein